MYRKHHQTAITLLCCYSSSSIHFSWAWKLYKNIWKCRKLNKVSLTIVFCCLICLWIDNVRFIFGSHVGVWKWRCICELWCGERGEKMREKLTPNYSNSDFFPFLSFMRKFLLKYKSVYNVCERMEMTVFFLSLSRFQKDITMKWLVTINFRWCNYPTKVHNHSIIQRMYHQSQVHLWHRR